MHAGLLGNRRHLSGVFESMDIDAGEEVMTGKKQKATSPEAPKAVNVPSRLEFPNVTVEREEQAVTMLDYEGSPVVTYRVGDSGPKHERSRGAS